MTTDFEHLKTGLEDGIMTIVIDRPDCRNAINLHTIRELYEVLESSENDSAVRVLILTGAGDKVFVSGADIRDLLERKRAESLEGLNSRLFSTIEAHPKPVIAAVNGIAPGGACELAMACDLRIAAEHARFGFPETGLGIMPAAGGTHRLPRLVGYGKAKELVLTGEMIPAREAWRIGLVNRVVPADGLMAAARGVAEQIMRKAPLAVQLAKSSLNLASNTSMRTGCEYESIAQAILFESEDKEEGMTAFLEKRAPRFEGR
jgi:enoyl-CoA hydratase